MCWPSSLDFDLSKETNWKILYGATGVIWVFIQQTFFSVSMCRVGSVLSSDFVPENAKFPGTGILLPTTNMSASFRHPSRTASCREAWPAIWVTQMISCLSILAFLWFFSPVYKGHEYFMLKKKKMKRMNAGFRNWGLLLFFRTWNSLRDQLAQSQILQLNEPQGYKI